MAFPVDFVWGIASSAYQIEGAAAEEGRGPSVWDTFCRRPGSIWGGHTGDIACDHYHRFAGDVGLMQEIGVRAYRFSVSWSRVLPEGTGTVNGPGIAFYDRLVDALLRAGISPWVTLFHWDYPLGLAQRGGWLNPDSAEWFADYVALVVRALSDRVEHWITINEPSVFVELGHSQGTHAPGLRLGLDEVLLAAHRVLLAHGRGVQAIRAHAALGPRVGYAPVGIPCVPFRDTPEDLAACRELTFRVDGSNLWNNAWWMDPVLLGGYPEAGLRAYGAAAPRATAAELDLIRQPLDFFGVNTYFGHRARQGKDGQPEIVEYPPGWPLTAYNWHVLPEVLRYGPRLFHERYGLPVVVTENGISCRDWVARDGRVHDPGRIDYLGRHLGELGRASLDGVPIAGYFHWSLLDNFEWLDGYKERFGLVYVDYADQARILKDSALYYRDVIASNGASLDRVP
jgi:beta-glucosidase